MTSDLNMFHGRMSDFVSFPLILFILVIKLRSFGFESQRNTLIFVIKIYMMLDLNMPHEKMSDFVSFLLFRFTLVLKLKNFDFKVIEIL